MKVIYDPKELEGSCYIEILPGKYNGVCWNSESIYFDEESFTFFEKTISMAQPNYDHFAFTEIDQKAWRRIVDQLDIIREFLEENPKIDEIDNYFDFIYEYIRQEFVDDFEKNVTKLAALFKEFQSWIVRKLQSHDYISVLGI